MQKDTLDYEEEKHMKLDCRMNASWNPRVQLYGSQP